MAINSRQKGKRGELELANILKDYGYMARRGQQYCGSNGDADVVGLWGLHIECKRAEHLNLYEAIEQSKRDKKDYELASVFHRRDRKGWLVTMPIEDFMRLYAESRAEALPPREEYKSGNN